MSVRTAKEIPMHRHLLSILIPALAFLPILGSATPASAIAIYTYTGNNFTSIYDVTPPEGAYDASMNVSGSFTLTSPLPADMGQADVTTLPGFTFAFSDGRTPFSDPSHIWSFEIAMTSGAISSWGIEIATSLADLNEAGDQQYVLITEYDGASSSLDQGFVAECMGINCRHHPVNINVDDASVEGNPGSWSFIPEPTTVLLLAAGLAGLGVLRRRRAAR